MKTKQFFPFLLIAVVLLVGSCKKDEDKEPDIEVKNELVYNGQTFPLNTGNIVEYGFDNTHYNNEFYLMQLNDGEDIVPVVLFVDLFSPTSDGFKGGTFDFINWEEEDVDKKYYFDEGQLYVNLSIANETAEGIYEIQGGTVSVSGSDANYKVSFDLVLDNGESVKGSYGGLFHKSEASGASSMEAQSIQVMKGFEIRKK